MCRKNQLYGWAIIAFGLGLALGTKIGAGFLTGCIVFGVIAFGVSLLCKSSRY